MAAAARLVFLLAGVSAYKTAAPPVIDTGQTALTRGERAFLHDFFAGGLGEFAYRNSIDLSGLRIEGPDAPEAPGTTGPAVRDPGPELPAAGRARALVPFGGGIDSIVTVEMVRHRADMALFVVSRPGDRFEAIERPAAVTGLPVVRADREIDPQLLRSRELGFLNGHVPVTGIISAIAVMAAALEGRDAVVMSNEWSASVPTVQAGDQVVNHQYSKSAAFEAAFRGVLAETSARLPAGAAMPDYFSVLRPRTELWIAERFAQLKPYHGTFRSCNRAFHINKAQRLDHWCGQCDKCCFVDLILAPFLPAADLGASSAAGSRSPTVPWRAGSARCWATPTSASRSNASGRSTSAARPCCSRMPVMTGRASRCCTNWPPRCGRCPAARRRRACCSLSERTSFPPPTRRNSSRDRCPSQAFLVRPAGRPCRSVGPRP